MNAHDVLREEKKRSVRIVSEDELENLEVPPLTTESLFDEFQPIVPVVIEFPDGSERLVKVRRFNSAEAFSGIGVYAFIQDDGTIDEEGMSKDDKIELSVKIKHRMVVVGMEDPMFKFAGAEADGYPIESLGGVYLNLFFDAVQAVNNPQEVQDFLSAFRETDADGAGAFSNVDAGEEGGAVSSETESDGSLSVSDETVSASGDGD